MKGHGSRCNTSGIHIFGTIPLSRVNSLVPSPFPPPPRRRFPLQPLALLVVLALALPGLLPARARSSAPAAVAPDPAAALYAELRLEGILSREVFEAAYERVARTGAVAGRLAIADMSQPSTAERLVVLDLDARAIISKTWVAHGQGSGELMADRFSNRHNSHQTSLGLYRVGQRITSRKHGAALLLEGLDRGVNDQARAREVIIHGADYVSADFVARHGRLGRSWGCPAVPREQMAIMIEALADGGFLYVHGA